MINKQSVIVAIKDGLSVTVTSPDGEALFQVPIPRGATRAGTFLKYQRDGLTLTFPDGVQIVQSPGHSFIDMPSNHDHTAAVPSVAPTVATAMENMLLRRLRSTEMQQARMIAEMKASVGHEAARIAAEQIKQALEAAAKPVADAAPLENNEGASSDAQQP